MNNNVFGSEKYSKIKKTTLEHYGVDCIFKDTEFIKARSENRKKSNLEKRMSAQWINHVIEKRIAPRKFEILDVKIKDGVWFTLKCPECGKPFIWSEELRIQTGTHANPYCEECTKGRNQSLEEKEVLEFIKSFYKGKIITNTKAVIAPKELDIFLPDLSLAVEYDGAHWHSQEDIKQKIKLCSQKGIKVLNILDLYWKKENTRIKKLLMDFINSSADISLENETVIQKLASKKDITPEETNIIVESKHDCQNLPKHYRVTYHCNICGKENRILVQNLLNKEGTLCSSCSKQQKMKDFWAKK